MIKIERASLNFGSRAIFNDVTISFQTDQKIGLVGPNGAGKSTLLKILARQGQLDSGKITVSGGTSLAYLPQEITLNSEKSVLDEALTSFAGYHVWEQIQQIEAQLKERPDDANLLARLAQETAVLYDYNFDEEVAKTKRILLGLGFKVEQLNNPVNQLSVGWRMRIVLAKLLLQEASFYLFDEPTNHLDIVAKTWFLKFLKAADFGFLLVCHDKYFLENLCEQIVEVEQGRATPYSGNYSDYQRQKADNLARHQTAYAEQQREISRKQATADRFRAKASKAKMAQSILKQLDKIEKIEPPSSSRKINVKLKTPPTAGKVVLNIRQVSHSFNKPIFQNLSFEIERGQKVAIIAPNGSGKTTLFNVICKKLPLQKGQVEFGHNVTPAIFEQDQNVALDHRKTILDEIRDNCPNVTEQELRGMAGAFLFSNDDIYKPIKVLSGGEKNRVCMIKVLLSGANVLFLDEPTNHLDIQSKEILLDALQQYAGTILFVSHDHDFVNELATHTIFLKPDSAHVYEGSYEDYLEQTEEPVNRNSSKKKVVTPKANSSSEDHSRQMRKVEQAISRLEAEIIKIEYGFDGLLYGTPAFDAQTKKLNNAKKDLADQMKLWEDLISQN